MSETRYRPEQLNERARSLLWLGNDDNRTEASSEFYRGAASMLRQAASDARVIAQLRETLVQCIEGQREKEPSRAAHYQLVLTELDRLTRPADEAEK